MSETVAVPVWVVVAAVFGLAFLSFSLGCQREANRVLRRRIDLVRQEWMVASPEEQFIE